MSSAAVKPVEKASKPKKPSAAKRTKSSPTHPPFFQMISEAIISLKERTGSSQYAITKFNEERHKQLPSNFRKLLLVQLKKLVAADKIVKVKNSYKLPSARSVKEKSAAAAAAAAPVAKSKAKTAAKPKPKPKTVAKSKAAAAAVKPKAAVKVKKVAPKPKPVAKPAKAARTSSRTSPGKKPLPAAKTKKKIVKSPARKVQARKVKK